MSFLWVWIIFAGQIFKQISTMKNSQCQRWRIHIPMRTFYLELICCNYFHNEKRPNKDFNKTLFK